MWDVVPELLHLLLLLFLSFLMLVGLPLCVLLHLFLIALLVCMPMLCRGLRVGCAGCTASGDKSRVTRLVSISVLIVEMSRARVLWLRERRSRGTLGRRTLWM